ncbi:murein hydrolase activator EnvC family protein [Humibacter ginsengisoli]
MSSPRRLIATRAVSAVAAATLALALTGTPEPASASPSSSGSVARPPAASPTSVSTPAVQQDAGWVWPVAGPRTVLRPYEAPASRYAAGHRGIDIVAPPGASVLAPESGTVRFAGVVVDRPTVTVQAGPGVLISIEPVATTLSAGDAVTRGGALGAVATGGHCDARCIHLGVRVDGEYVSPMRYFGGVPRAVLLPLR